MLTPEVVARFWTKVAAGEPDDCWLWTAGCFTSGYGSFCYDGKDRRAHRVALHAVTGVEPSGEVRHSCDEPRCCNPAHLTDGTHDENMADMVARGRSNNGRRGWTRCVNGHPFDASNTSYYAGKRRCLACHRDRQRRAP